MDTVSDRLRRLGALAWATIGILVLAWALLRLLGFFRVVVPPLLMATLVFVILHPVVTWLERNGVRRHLGTAVCFFGLAGALAGIGYLVIPVMVEQARTLLAQLPALLAGYQSRLEGEAAEAVAPLVDRMAGWITDSEGVLGAGRQVFAFAGSIITTLLSMLLGAVIAFYAVADFPRLRVAVRSVLPPRARPVLQRLFDETLVTTTEFLQVRLFLGLVVGVLGTIGFMLIDLPYWLLLGFFLGATNTIPILGTYIGSVPPLLVAFLTLGPSGVVWTLGVLVLSSAVDGYVLTPLVVRHHMNLHPIAVILAVLIGGAWYGVWGVMFAIPLLAAGRSFLGEYLRLRGYLRPETEDEEDGAPVPLPLQELVGP